MRRIELTQRTARLLRDNLVSNQEGYDYLDLCRLDNLAKKLTGLQGAYGERIAELVRDSKRARRELLKLPNPNDPGSPDVQRLGNLLTLYQLEEEAEHEAAEAVAVALIVEDGDWKLISDKLAGVSKWVGADSVRAGIIAMVEAVKNAETVMDADSEARKDGHKKEPVPAGARD